MKTDVFYETELYAVSYGNLSNCQVAKFLEGNGFFLFKLIITSNL